VREGRKKIKKRRVRKKFIGWRKKYSHTIFGRGLAIEGIARVYFLAGRLCN
jgi:hypothetical protein